MGSRQEWHKIMLQTIKLDNGDRWSVRGREIRGMNKTQVTYRFQDGLGMKNPRSAVFLPYDWNSRNQSKIITAVADLKRLVDERNLSLKEAAKFMLEPVANDQAPSVTNWGNIVDSFLDSRSDRRGTTLRDLKTRMRRVLVRPKHGHYALAPEHLQHLISLQSMEGKESKSIDITSVVNVPHTIPEGKEVLPEGKEVGNYQTPLFVNDLD